MKADLLDRLVGEDENDDVDGPGNEEQNECDGLLSREKTDVAQAQESLHDEDCGHSERVGEGAAVGALEKSVDQDRIGDVIEDEGNEQREHPVPGWKGREDAGSGPEAELVEDQDSNAESDLGSQREDEAVDGLLAEWGKTERDGGLGRSTGGSGAEASEAIFVER